jgi:hypothetical protein
MPGFVVSYILEQDECSPETPTPGLSPDPRYRRESHGASTYEEGVQPNRLVLRTLGEV